MSTNPVRKAKGADRPTGNKLASLVDWEIFGLLLKEYRRRGQLTQNALSSSSGLVGSYISQIEHGKKSNVSLEAIKSLGEAVGIDPRVMMILCMPLDKYIIKLISNHKKLDRYNRIGDLIPIIGESPKTEPIELLQFKFWYELVCKERLEHVFDEYFINQP